MGDGVVKNYLKKNTGWLVMGLFFAVLLSYNISTFLGIWFHTGYAHGTVVRTGAHSKSNLPYAVYSYTVGNKTYQKKQEGTYSEGSGYLVVYDQNDPVYSMIADYPYPVTDSLIRFNLVVPDDVSYSWLDYLPDNY